MLGPLDQSNIGDNSWRLALAKHKNHYKRQYFSVQYLRKKYVGVLIFESTRFLEQAVTATKQGHGELSHTVTFDFFHFATQITWSKPAKLEPPHSACVFISLEVSHRSQQDMENHRLVKAAFIIIITNWSYMVSARPFKLSHSNCTLENCWDFLPLNPMEARCGPQWPEAPEPQKITPAQFSL